MDGGAFAIAPTSSFDRRGEFVCILSEAAARSHGLGDKRLALLTRSITDSFALTAICRAYTDPSVPDTTVQIDHTLRRALGFDDDDDVVKSVDVWPVSRPWQRRFADAAARVIGVQYVHFRVYRTDIIDAEKKVCRVPKDAFALLGCDEGDVVVCEGVARLPDGGWELRRVRLRALEGPDDPPTDVDERPEVPLIGTFHDLRPLRVDMQARGDLETAVQCSVRVRRDVRRRVLDGIREGGVALFVSLFAATRILDSTGVVRGLALAGVVLAVVGLLYWKVRGELP